MKLPSIIAVTALAAAGTAVVVSAPANAALVTSCIGEGGAVTVPGDLIVPAGESCALDGTTVTGQVTVEAGADLVVSGGTFQGTVTVLQDGFLDAVDTSISGAVTASSAFGSYFEGGTVGAYTGRVLAGADTDSFVYTDSTTVTGAVNVTGGEIFLESTRVGGNLITADALFTDVVDSTIKRGLFVRNNEQGGVFVDSEVYGSAVYDGNSDLLQLGADGPLTTAEGASVWGGNVTVRNNDADIYVSNNIVAGNLGGTGNDPAPTGSNNRVRGTVSGQFADLAPTPDLAAARTAAAAPTDRQAELDAGVTDRRAAATKDAALAGDADL